MPTSQSVVTKAEVDAINTLLDQISSSLHAHQDGNVSSQHPDNSGYSFTAEDSVYSDSDGNIEATAVVKITVAGVDYYAPAKPGVADISAPALSKTAPGVSGPTALITPFSDTAVGELTAKIALLSAHTLKAYNSASTAPHGVLSVTSSNTLDSGDNKVGRKLVRISVGGSQYDIVCDTSKTGPPKKPKISYLSYTTWWNTDESKAAAAKIAYSQTIANGSGAHDPYHTRITPTLFGSRPMRYKWSYYARDGWHDIENPTQLTATNLIGGGSGIPYTKDLPASPRNNVGYWHTDDDWTSWYTNTSADLTNENSHDGSLIFDDARGPGGSDTASHRLWLKVANEATLHDGGNPDVDDDYDWIDTDTSGIPLIFTQTIKDDSDCCWLFTETLKHRKATKSDKFKIYKIHTWAKKHRSAYAEFYIKRGRELIERMREAKHDFTADIDKLNSVFSLASNEAKFEAFYRLIYGYVLQYWNDCDDSFILELKAKLNPS